MPRRFIHPDGRKFSHGERFFEYVEPCPSTGCHLWIGEWNLFGYGRFTIARKRIYAHRYAWSMKNGDIPNGLYVCHKCETRCCVIPYHMFLGTLKQNMEDCVRKGRQHKGEERSKIAVRKLNKDMAMDIFNDPRSQRAI